MAPNEIAMLHLLIQRLEDCAAAYASYAEHFPKEQRVELSEYGKRLLTSAECLKMDLLEARLTETLVGQKRYC